MKRFKQLLLAPTLGVMMLSLVILLTVLRPIQAAPPARPLMVPGNPVTTPVSNTHTAPTTTTVSITYDEAINAATVSTQTFAVHGMQTGPLTQTYAVNGGTISLTPSQPFKPGELVQVSATTGTLGTVSGQGPISSTVWQFRTAVEGGSGVFTDSGQSLGGQNSNGIALGDLNGDGSLDAFVANSDVAGRVNKVWLNDGMGNFTSNGQSLGNAESRDVALGDVDGDGDLDALVANGNIPVGGGSKVWLNNGAGLFFDSGQSLSSGGLNDAVTLGDLDGDGDLDVILENGFAQHEVWFNDGTGVFIDTGQALGASAAREIALGDLDGDGDLDTFFANGPGPGSEPNRVWLNDGTGVFIDSNQALGNGVSLAASLGDVDGDGDLDALVANGFGQVDKLWLNDGTGVFTDSNQSLGSGNGSSAVLGDVDGDGDLDAFITHFTGEASKIWLNDGHGVFSDSGQSLGNSSTNDVSLGDLDGDGALDAFMVNYLAQGNEVWFNTPGTPIQFSGSAYSVIENAGTATITATLGAPSILTRTVNYASSDGTALAGSDYQTVTGTLIFVPGTMTQVFTITITNDGLDEPNETVTLILNNPGNTTLGTPNLATLTIVDDDMAAMMMVYLPIIIKPPPTILSVHNDNTGGDLTFVVRDPATNAEITRCTVPNNQTLLCDHDGDDSHIFPPGIYLVQAFTACGGINPNPIATKTYGSGPQTSVVSCLP